MTLHKIADAIRDEHEAIFKFIEQVHNCPAVWYVSFAIYKDTKHKKQKMDELAEKQGFVYQRFLFLLFSSSVSPFYVTTVS